MFSLKLFMEMKTMQTYSGIDPQVPATSKSVISEISSLYQRRKKGATLKCELSFKKNRKSFLSRVKALRDELNFRERRMNFTQSRMVAILQ